MKKNFMGVSFAAALVAASGLVQIAGSTNPAVSLFLPSAAYEECGDLGWEYQFTSDRQVPVYIRKYYSSPPRCLLDKFLLKLVNETEKPQDVHVYAMCKDWREDRKITVPAKTTRDSGDDVTFYPKPADERCYIPRVNSEPYDEYAR